MANEVFISYSRKDYEKVKAVKDEIDSLVGIDCWMDLDGIESGEWFKKVIISAINRHDTLLFMLTPNSMNSPFAMKELGFAAKKGKRIVLVDLENTQLNDDFIFDYSDKDNIDWNDPLQHGKLINNLKTWFPIRYKQEIENTEISAENSNSVNVVSGDTITVRVGNIQFDMICVEGGTLEIGATREQKPFAGNNEYPAHSVNLPTFYIGQFPVTQNLWEKVMGYNHSYNQQSEKELVFDLERKKVQAAVMNAMNPTASSINNMDTDYGHYPVENLSYNEAIQFVRRLSELTDLKFDLPTEEEWEYAARGGQKSRHYRYAGSNNIEDVAWYRNNSSLRTHPVGEKQANELGIYDMSGNVWEWTKSKAHSYGEDVSPDNKMLIRRGGSAIHVDKNCRVSFRYETKRSKHNMGSGLRVVIRENIDK